MNVSMSGKEIKKFWPDPEINIITQPCDKVYLSATYHGDHDEFWIVVEDVQGEEKCRYNANKVKAIEWV